MNRIFNIDLVYKVHYAHPAESRYDWRSGYATELPFAELNIELC